MNNTVYIEYIDAPDLNKYPEIEDSDKLDEMITHIAEICLENEKIEIPAEINVYIAEDAYIRELNKEYRGKDMPTDVLSFPMTASLNGQLVYDAGDFEDGKLILGDIAVSLEKAAAQASEYGHGLWRELGFLVSHGVYHLLGYDHEDGSEEMFIKQEEVLHKAGLERKIK